MTEKSKIARAGKASRSVFPGSNAKREGAGIERRATEAKRDALGTFKSAAKLFSNRSPR